MSQFCPLNINYLYLQIFLSVLSSGVCMVSPVLVQVNHVGKPRTAEHFDQLSVAD